MPTQDPQKMLKDLALELGKVHKELDKTKDGGKKRGTKELEAAALTNILEALAKGVDLVRNMLEKGSEDNCPRVKNLEVKTRSLEDTNDLLHQRSLKGKFVISSPRNKTSIASQEKLQDEGKSLPKYVTQLVFNKLGVKMKEDDIISCHHTSGGMIIFRLGDFKPGSSFHQVVSAIKSGAGKDVTDIFVNFALTPRRAALLYEVRQLKKGNKILRFLTDSDGSITVVRHDGSKMKLTKSRGGAKIAGGGGKAGDQGAKTDDGGAKAKNGAALKTFTNEELKDHFTI